MYVLCRKNEEIGSVSPKGAGEFSPSYIIFGGQSAFQAYYLQDAAWVCTSAAHASPTLLGQSGARGWGNAGQNGDRTSNWRLALVV